jgi:hypothetical protein
MGCNCGRRRVIRQDQQTTATSVERRAEALVASADVREIDLAENRTDPATGTARSSDDAA